MPFERFVSPSRYVPCPLLTIYPRGQLALNVAVRHQFSLATYSHVVLYFDAQTNRIGLSPTRDVQEAGAMPLRNATSGLIINAHAFLLSIGALPVITQRFRLQYDADTGFYTADLTMPIPPLRPQNTRTNRHKAPHATRTAV